MEKGCIENATLTSAYVRLAECVQRFNKIIESSDTLVCMFEGTLNDPKETPCNDHEVTEPKQLVHKFNTLASELERKFDQIYDNLDRVTKLVD